MLIVNGNHAYGTNHLIELYVDSDDKIIAVFHTGSEQGFCTPTIYRGDDAKEVFQSIVRSIVHGLEVIRIGSEKHEE